MDSISVDRYGNKTQDWIDGYMVGAMERDTLAIANSELRSRVRELERLLHRVDL